MLIAHKSNIPYKKREFQFEKELVGTELYPPYSKVPTEAGGGMISFWGV
jgi:hypothetical protein